MLFHIIMSRWTISIIFKFYCKQSQDPFRCIFRGHIDENNLLIEKHDLGTKLRFALRGFVS